jgi:predicted acyl esterase
MKPGEIHKIAFDVGNLSHVFNRGHRVRISLSSTGAPSYYPNPQTGEPLTADAPQKTATATMTVYHSGSHTSQIIAPVVGEKIARQ